MKHVCISMYKIMKKIMLLSLAVMVCTADKSVYAASVTDKEAKQAYAKELRNLPKNTDYNNEWEFALIDLNKDGVSEMVITHDEGYHLTIYAYVNGKAESVGSGFAGEQKYYPNKKMYYSTTFHGSVYIEYNRFNGKKMIKLASIEGDIKGEDTYTYYIGKKKVSKAKWKKYEKKLKKGAKAKKLIYHKNTSANRKKYLQ